MDNDKNNMKDKGKRISRRDALKGLATVPFVGAVAYGVLKKKHYQSQLNYLYAEDLNLPIEQLQTKMPGSSEKEIKIGFIGYGIRGKQLAKALGFVHPTQIDKWKQAAVENPNDTNYKEFMSQQDLNVRITAVCDIYDTYGNMAQEMAANHKRQGTDSMLEELPKRYSNYKELIHSPDVDAVIIATSDHWHGPMTIEAAKTGKHVYCEKPMTWSVEETYEVRKAVKENGVIFQLGHQGRQTDTYIKAKEVLKRDLLGPVTLIEVTTNRNDANGAWIYPIPEDASEKTIDWKQFVGQAPWHDFSLERFFRWRCWWDYSSGLSGDLLTHEFDAINQIMELGIPHSATSTGGIYYFKDGRTVPDVLNTVFEFPDRNLSLLYSATQASQMPRGKRIMGHDAYMDLGGLLNVYPDGQSTKYADKLKDGTLDLEKPLYSFTPGKSDVDAVTSATEKYFSSRGLLYTFVEGKKVDTTHLHIIEWLNCIRNGGTPSCNIDQGFEEAMTAHMGTLSYKHKKTVFWDKENEKIII